MATILAIIFSLIPVSNQGKSWWEYAPTAYAVIVAVFLAVDTVTPSSNFRLKKNAVVKQTKRIMDNATSSIVMFGGDLSWADDYKGTIEQLTKHGQSVEIIFPATKFANLSKNALRAFNERVETLRASGARIYYTEDDLGLRCTMANVNIEVPDSVSEDLVIIKSKRVNRSFNDSKKLRYEVEYYRRNNKNERNQCDFIYQVYKYICKSKGKQPY